MTARKRPGTRKYLARDWQPQLPSPLNPYLMESPNPCLRGRLHSYERS
ncbi:hypothetical protein FOMG_20027 [Fusarium oxysporum f. sp. melonis 26406]|uniref:Uncharacterized protein n=1 Tax=Fusarium oxysporum f. sp. melonis 26406 TaxID=1089452 RepID=W9Z3J4_FUSOX|nr:hypothetical protein FOMG_20027 [Fusarium oxysporum f. sp. melonis 26406]